MKHTWADHPDYPRSAPPMPISKEKRFSNLKLAFVKARANHIRDKIERKLAEQGIHYNDFDVHTLNWGQRTEYRVRTINAPIPPQIRDALVHVASRYAHTYRDFFTTFTLLRLCSEFPSYSPMDLKKIDSCKSAFSAFERVQSQIRELYDEIEHWKRVENVDDKVYLSPGICDITGEPRIFALLGENTYGDSDWYAENEPEKVRAFLRTLLAYESFEDSPYNKAK